MEGFLGEHCGGGGVNELELPVRSMSGGILESQGKEVHGKIRSSFQGMRHLKLRSGKVTEMAINSKG